MSIGIGDGRSQTTPSPGLWPSNGPPVPLPPSLEREIRNLSSENDYNASDHLNTPVASPPPRRVVELRDDGRPLGDAVAGRCVALSDAIRRSRVVLPQPFRPLRGLASAHVELPCARRRDRARGPLHRPRASLLDQQVDRDGDRPARALSPARTAQPVQRLVHDRRGGKQLADQFYHHPLVQGLIPPKHGEDPLLDPTAVKN